MCRAFSFRSALPALLLATLTGLVLPALLLAALLTTLVLLAALLLVLVIWVWIAHRLFPSLLTP
jgi:hypothetical protein